jgi:tRNA threonylcarbamoyladenosine biosynthesis protein TsaB
MKVLGIDTAIGACSAAVWDQTVKASHQKVMSRGHVEELVPMVKRTLKKSGLTFSQLDLIAVTIGPGSFTGLRTGLAAAKGLGLALNIPVHGVTTLEAVAFAAKRERLLKAKNPIVVVFETNRDEIFWQQFDGNAIEQSEATAMSESFIVERLPTGAFCLCGDAAGKILAALPQLEREQINQLTTVQRPMAKDVAEIAAGRFEHPISAEPFYIHPPAAKIPVSGGRSRP